MLRSRFRTLAVAALAALFVPDAECYAALASRLTGTKRFTARLSSNRAIRRQQLIVDPEGILGGSASVAYDPRVVRLVDVIDPADFEVTGGFVGVVSGEGGLVNPLLPLDAFLGEAGRVSAGADGDPVLRELGYAQVFFDRRPDESLRAPPAAAGPDDGSSVIPNLPGYLTVDEDGPTGVVDTHALIFEYLPDAPAGAVAAYTVFAAEPRLGTTPDFLIAADDPQNPIPYTDLGKASVSGSLGVESGYYQGPPPAPVPLPPAALGGLATLAGMAGLFVRRRHAMARQA